MSASKPNPWERPAGQLGRFRFSTDDLPAKERLAIVNEVVAKRTRRQHIALRPEDRYYVHGESCVLPGMVAYRSSFSPMRIVRSRELLSDGNDSFVFSWFDQARLSTYRQRELAVGAGEATLIFASDQGSGIFPAATNHAVIMLPRNKLAPLLRDIDGCLMRPLPAGSPALGLLLRYLDIVYDQSAAPFALQEAIVAHVCDLIGVMCGATRDAEQEAKNRGIRAARLHVLKKTIRENLLNGGLSVSAIAARHRLTPRYVQMLFEESGTTFTEFVRSERLARAYRLLTSPATRDRKVLDIAISCGFGDLSHFNRAFRTHFGATPSDVRVHSTGTGSLAGS